MMEIDGDELPHGFRAAVVAALNVYAKSLPNGVPVGGVEVMLAGGAAVNYWFAGRATDDIDAECSPRFPKPTKRFLYVTETGERKQLYFDPKYNPMLSFLHEDYQDDAAVADKFVGVDPRLRVTVMQPIDIAISKLSRFSDKDQSDILLLGQGGFFSVEELERRANDALVCQIGSNPGQLRHNLSVICKRLAQSLVGEDNTATQFKKPRRP